MPPSLIVIIIIVPAWAELVLHGVPAEAATAGLGAVVGLGLRIAARLAKRTEHVRG